MKWVAADCLYSLVESGLRESCKHANRHRCLEGKEQPTILHVLLLRVTRQVGLLRRKVWFLERIIRHRRRVRRGHQGRSAVPIVLVRQVLLPRAIVHLAWGPVCWSICWGRSGGLGIRVRVRIKLLVLLLGGQLLGGEMTCACIIGLSSAGSVHRTSPIAVLVGHGAVPLVTRRECQWDGPAGVCISGLTVIGGMERRKAVSKVVSAGSTLASSSSLDGETIIDLSRAAE